MSEEVRDRITFDGELRATEIVGYSDPMTAAPGETVAFKVSCTASRFGFDLVRLLHGDENPAGPGFLEAELECPAAGEYPGREQPLNFGSCVEVADHPLLRLVGAITLHAWVLPTQPAKGVQGLLTKWDGARGYGLFIGADGDAQFWAGDGETVERVGTGRPLRAGRWHLVSASYDSGTGRVRVSQTALVRWPGDGSTAAVEAPIPGPAPNEARLIIAGHDAGRRVAAVFNGKIDAPRLYGVPLGAEAIEVSARAGAAGARADGLVAAWDFSLRPGTRDVIDLSPNQFHGRTVNTPARGMTGWNWTGRETVFHRAPGEYGAIHFHDDDLTDAGWETDVELVLPPDLPSGIYAARLRTSTAEDHVPFFVRPRPGTADSDIAYLVPSTTYLAYANLAATQSWEDQGEPLRPGELEMRLLSLYDVHDDGSGTCYSSRLRPNLTMRPKVRLKFPDVPGRWENVPSYPHLLPADLHLTHWLGHKGHEADILTDEILHREGAKLLSPYKVVIIGTHAEYWSERMLDAVQAYLRAGGRVMYLGGNGFYWVTSYSPEEPHVIEVRRTAGARAWAAGPGEGHLSTTGEPGGIWRHRGRPPQGLVGVGFTAAGYDRAAPYRRSARSREPDVAFVFEGIADDHDLLGDHPSLVQQHGAAGYEVDRADTALGTPEGAAVLASSSPSDHSSSYESDPSDIPIGAADWPVKADLVLVPYPNGGAVFSTGSIAWCGALAHNGYDNDISRITDNVLRAFASGEPLCGPDRDTIHGGGRPE
ncbi:N,N-dimethylformamidase beta subunit family domain-containing protein [Actinomadura bangladeshensis]|uniref:LamG domain-containing protein n=1 Tax=Actinomadura bangladeshensis TaxID=453573 RepID=A0A4R4PF26_9ACTN|nr:N,N-dimethylformamidase beta subunit family domain-containing protein [Actinomadura bangladeshensis]TDC20412.1 LamG domain-containing protein [Actinomadura bangladeshensis]